MNGNANVNERNFQIEPCPVCSSLKTGLWGTAPDIGNPEVRHSIAKCFECYHLFNTPMPSAEYLRRAYLNSAPSVFSDDGFFEKRSAGSFSAGDLLVWETIRSLNVPGKLLDIGSANLTLLKNIGNRGWRLTVIEPGNHVWTINRETGCNVCRDTFENCDFKQKFDVISAIDVIEHVVSPLNFLKQVKKNLAENGIALFRFPNSGSLRCRFEGQNWKMIRPLGHLHYFSVKSFKRSCTRTGLAIRRMKSHDIHRYGKLTAGKIRLRGLQYLKPVVKAFDLLLWGDQLLVKLNHLNE